MQMTNEYINDQLNKAQKLLWGGSETENIEAHNIIARLIKDREDLIQNSQGRKKSVTTTTKYRRNQAIYKFVNS